MRTMNIRLIRFHSILLFFILLLFSILPAFAETEDIDLAEELEEWVDLEEESRDILTATDIFYHTPNEQSPVKCDHETCFWKMEMGNLDGEAVWKVLTQPVTVLSGAQREQVRVLARPEEDCMEIVTSRDWHPGAFPENPDESAVRADAEHYLSEHDPSFRPLRSFLLRIESERCLAYCMVM